MTTINHARNAELRDKKRIRELRVQRLEKALIEAIPDSDNFKWLANEIVTEEKWIKYYGLLLSGLEYMTEELAQFIAFGKAL